MSEHVLELEQHLERPIDDVFAFFSEARNLERITPPWLRFEVLSPPTEMCAGVQIGYRLRLHGLPLRWVSLIEAWEPGEAFVDRQLRGPYRLWVHRHEFERAGSGTVVRDRVRYALPLGRIGDVAGRRLVARELDRVFAFRRAAVTRFLG